MPFQYCFTTSQILQCRTHIVSQKFVCRKGVTSCYGCGRQDHLRNKCGVPATSAVEKDIFGVFATATDSVRETLRRGRLCVISLVLRRSFYSAIFSRWKITASPYRHWQLYFFSFSRSVSGKKRSNTLKTLEMSSCQVISVEESIWLNNLCTRDGRKLGMFAHMLLIS